MSQALCSHIGCGRRPREESARRCEDKEPTERVFKSNDSFELRERAVGMVAEQTPEHGSEWAAICSVAEKLGCGTETLRK